MRNNWKVTIVLTVLAILLATAPALTAQQTSSQGTPTAQKERATYRLDFVLTELENGKKVNSRSYSVMAQEGVGRGRSSLRVGSRVPIVSTTGGRDGVPPTPTVVYMDVGVNIDFYLEGADENVSFRDGGLEISAITVPPPGTEPAARNPVIRQTRAGFAGAIVPGKPTLLVSVDEIDSPRRLQVEATATRLK